MIGSRNSSPWSLATWLAMRVFDVPFEDVLVPLDRPETEGLLQRFSPSGRLPVLVDGKVTIWESLAILEYLAEHHPQMWPDDPAARALARSVATEIHGGFTALGTFLPMDMIARFAPPGRLLRAVAMDVKRIRRIWTELRGTYGKTGGGPFLFGRFTIADAMCAPLVSRFVTYALPQDPLVAAYVEAVMGLPAMREWVAEAGSEVAAFARVPTPPFHRTAAEAPVLIEEDAPPAPRAAGLLGLDRPQLEEVPQLAPGPAPVAAAKTMPAPATALEASPAGKAEAPQAAAATAAPPAIPPAARPQLDKVDRPAIAYLDEPPRPAARENATVERTGPALPPSAAARVPSVTSVPPIGYLDEPATPRRAPSPGAVPTGQDEERPQPERAAPAPIPAVTGARPARTSSPEPGRSLPAPATGHPLTVPPREPRLSAPAQVPPPRAVPPVRPPAQRPSVGSPPATPPPATTPARPMASSDLPPMVRLRRPGTAGMDDPGLLSNRFARAIAGNRPSESGVPESPPVRRPSAGTRPPAAQKDPATPADPAADPGSVGPARPAPVPEPPAGPRTIRPSSIKPIGFSGQRRR
ncbi:MAG TPA: glutathione S-transferase N-terminal domain-containing protein [Geminicoccus sp.]|uniref:glutathione S-transferase family protein n=1 Tax=Geminicoccus sp. TaxID=2024832 RepID=UPI002E303A10|nr:glutathione S-transferase N-terminal domain-containing protein [Geminicoccus sp.]HEX2527778.1 glutathione S-transferase N-terminal domain-containing protein [Geminicoccus sp.]